MGILNDLVMEKKRNYLIEELTKMNVTQSQLGKSIYELDYDDLKYELVLATFRKIDTAKDESKWF